MSEPKPIMPFVGGPFDGGSFRVPDGSPGFECPCEIVKDFDVTPLSEYTARPMWRAEPPHHLYVSDGKAMVYRGRAK